MISLGIKVFIARDRVRMNKSYDGVSLLVKDALKNDPLSGYMFVFFNKRSNYMKALYWDRNGFLYLAKTIGERNVSHFLHWQQLMGSQLSRATDVAFRS